MGKEDANGGHIEELRLEAYALRVSDDEESALIEEHLLWCEQCTSHMEEIDRYTQAMQKAAARIREEERQSHAVPGFGGRLLERFRRPLPIWGASVLVTAGLVLGVGVTLQRAEKPGPAVEVTLEALRGEADGVVKAGHALNLHLDNRGLPQADHYRLEIVNDVGTRVWDGTGTWVGDALLASATKSFRPGTYFIRVLPELDKGEPLREFKLVVESSR